MGKLPVDVGKLTEVNIGSVKTPGYECEEIKCITVTGYIDGEAGKVVYFDCVCEKEAAGACGYLQVLLGGEYQEGEKKVKHKRGQKGDIIDDILEDFSESDMKEIKIPIKVDKLDENTHPGYMKKAFLLLKDLYETELEPEVIEKMQKNEPVEKYVLTVRKVGEEKGVKAKIAERLKGLFGKSE